MNKRSIHQEYIRAGCVDTNTTELELLAKSAIEAVRRRVAENEKTPPEVLCFLAKDPSASVRMSVAINKMTPATTVGQLACDESPEVRYTLASASYTPKHILRQLAEDTNPFVSQRAKTMLTGLESKIGRMIGLFEFLSEDHAFLANQLDELVENYSKWSHDTVFDKTVDVLDGIKHHLERQQTMCLDWIDHCTSKSELLQRTFQKCSADQTKLIAEISNLLGQHIDGPDFHASLEQLLTSLRQHIELSENELFAHMKEQMPPEELDAINRRLNQSLLKGNRV